MHKAAKALLVCCTMAGLAGCAAKPPAPVAVSVPAAMPPPHDYAADAALLRLTLAHEVPHAMFPDAADNAEWISRTKAEFAAWPYKLNGPQLLVAVDRNPAVQQMRIILAVPGGQWEVIGGGKVSTGRSGRKDYYITPTGVFPHTDAILDYRAEGTYNENHIRGLGIKGMRVWDFGWQMAQKGWQGNGDLGEIRMLMHATDPDYLAQRLGRPDFRGLRACFRRDECVSRPERGAGCGLSAGGEDRPALCGNIGAGWRAIALCGDLSGDFRFLAA